MVLPWGQVAASGLGKETLCPTKLVLKVMERDIHPHEGSMHPGLLGEAGGVSSWGRRSVPAPGLVGLALAGVGWVAVFGVMPNTFATAIIVVVGMVLGMRVFLPRRGTRWPGSSVAMETMVGGTAGGFAGGIVTAILGIPGTHTGMALMTASMAGMVGGVLGGGWPDEP